ncbi:hypothetical protein MKEN_00537700 [Mycena kentingensis (nom. inval.)]|nr:hypothetical protein MKEN_00537700 [Mycena kentingensis (nom. inval.)]
MSKDQEYSPLMAEDVDNEPGTPTNPPPYKPRRIVERFAALFTQRVLAVLLGLETILLALAVISLTVKRRPSTCFVSAPKDKVLYSPALEAVEHEVKVYNVGFTGDLSPFQIASSPKLDQMWSDLYNFGISRIPKEQAALLPNKTHAIPGDPGYYIAELDVFHNLHCLNKVRMALDPDYYPDWRISTTGNWIETQKNATEHVNHCIDWIRQSIMCSSDTSVVVWQWKEWANTSLVQGNVAHTCRKFEKIQDWAKDRMLLKTYDPTVRIEDDIVVPIFHEDMS